MTKRKGKSGKPDDSLLLLDSPSVASPKGFKEYALPAIVFFIFAVGGSTAVWFSSQQQQTIESLTETVNAMQLRITKFQQQLGIGNAQVANVGVFEDRLRALEEAYTQAQKKAEVALAASEKIKSTDLHGQVWSLQSEMNTRLSELQQTSVSTTTLNAVVKNKTEELETLKQRLNSILSANTEVAVSISGLTDTVLVTKTRLEEQISTVEGFASELEDQRHELEGLKDSFASNQKTLEKSRQEVIDIKELLELEQERRAQALEEQLLSMRSNLEDHQKTTQSLNSHLAAQLEIIQTQMLADTEKSSEDDSLLKSLQVEEAVNESDEVSIKDDAETLALTVEETSAGEISVNEREVPKEALEEVVEENPLEERDVIEETVADDVEEHAEVLSNQDDEEVLSETVGMFEEMENISDAEEPVDEIQEEEVLMSNDDAVEELTKEGDETVDTEEPAEETLEEQSEDETTIEDPEMDSNVPEDDENLPEDVPEDNQEETVQDFQNQESNHAEDDVPDSEENVEEETVEELTEEDVKDLDENDISANESY